MGTAIGGDGHAVEFGFTVTCEEHTIAQICGDVVTEGIGSTKAKVTRKHSVGGGFFDAGFIAATAGSQFVFAAQKSGPDACPEVGGKIRIIVPVDIGVQKDSLQSPIGLCLDISPAHIDRFAKLYVGADGVF